MDYLSLIFSSSLRFLDLNLFFLPTNLVSSFIALGAPGIYCDVL